MDLIPLLKIFGLSETESIVYLIALKRQNFKVGDLADQLELKRPTIYHALHTLEEKGLVTMVGVKKVARFKAESPERLTTMLERHQTKINNSIKELNQALPFFPTAEEMPHILPKVEYFQGKEGIKNLGEKVLKNKSMEVFSIVPSFNVLEPISFDYYMEYFSDKKKKGRINSKTIWGEIPNKIFYKDHHASFREVRLAPEKMKDSFRSIILIWDNNVAIINLLPEMFGVLVRSFDYSQTMRAIWQTLWSISKQVKEDEI